MVISYDEFLLRKRMRSAWYHYLINSDYTHVLTINLNLSKKNWNYDGSNTAGAIVKYNTNQDVMRNINSLACDFHRRFDRGCFGVNFYKLKNFSLGRKVHRSEFVGFVENVYTNIHFHVFIKISADIKRDVDLALRTALKSLVPSATYKLDKLTSKRHKKRSAIYILKRCMKQECVDALFTSHATQSKFKEVF